MTDLKALAEAAKAATSDNWFHGEYSDIEYAPPKGDENGAHWFPVADELVPAVCDYLIAAQPSAILALYAERDEARAERDDLAQSLKQIMVADREAAEAALSSYKEEVERLRRVLAEARDDMEARQGYASDYFRDKHDAAGDLAKISEALNPDTLRHGNKRFKPKEPPHAE